MATVCRLYCKPWDLFNTVCRDPKDVSKEEYRLFYQNTFKDFKDPLAWHHFSGDSDDGVAFKAIVYVPSAL